MGKKLHLICNAHIDPVWQWEWEEGAAAALSTFRTAADICDENPEFIFCHNEAQLYMWIEEYEPPLFARIKRLVAEGRWHIMGGWYNQPDCNMPSGEGFMRQAEFGRRYFAKEFNTAPKTAVNFDPFGHTRGLVQILRRTGYDNYMFCRPISKNDCALPAEAFTWVGYDGSEITGRRVMSFYNSKLGCATEKISKVLAEMSDGGLDVCLWGVGNHGGGPSRKDIADIRQLIDWAAQNGDTIIHSTPDAYFEELKSRGSLPKHKGDLNAWGPGCYTSQIKIKKKYRKLENELFMTEKMAAHAVTAGLISDVSAELSNVCNVMMTAQFHDTLPGTSVQPVEQSALRGMDYGLEILSRIRARAFFALSAGREKPADDEIPIVVYNPHPYKVHATIECELMLWDQSWGHEFLVPTVYKDGTALPTQLEKENSNVPIDWRKRVSFQAELPPMDVSYFKCKFSMIPSRPAIKTVPENGFLCVQNDELSVAVNTNTGLISGLSWRGQRLLKPGAFKLVVMKDTVDPWSMFQQHWTDETGAFSLADEKSGSLISGVSSIIPSVRVIEDGDVRTVIEAVFTYERSYAIIQYIIPKPGNCIDVKVRLHWSEKQKMVKMLIPCDIESAVCEGETAFGLEMLPQNNRENISQRHITMSGSRHSICVINDGVYGSSCENSVLKITLIRSPAYAGHPIDDREILRQDRYTPHCDLGEHEYGFRLVFGERDDVSGRRGVMAALFNQKPYALSLFPSGNGEPPAPCLELSDNCIEMTAFKPTEDGVGYMLRLFNPTADRRELTVSIKAFSVCCNVELSPYSFESFFISDEKLILLDLERCRE